MKEVNKPQTFKYDAFISYSRKDEKFAKQLEAELEKYRSPQKLGLTQGRLNVFRDVQDLVGNELTESIKAAIQDSKHLIVICSPYSRQSFWVGKEIEEFARVHGSNGIIPVLLFGRPNHEVKPDEEIQDQAFHDALYKCLVDPLAADYRTFKQDTFQQRHERHREAKFHILAMLLKVEKETLLKRQRKRTIRLLSAASIFLFILSIAFGWIAYKAYQNAQRAERELRVATSRQLAVQAEAVLDKFPQRSLLLAVEALNATMQASEPRVADAEQALRDALAKVGGRGIYAHEASINAIAVSPDGHWLVTGSDDKTARIWDLTANDPAINSIVLRGHTRGIISLAISPNNRWIATGSLDNTARLWDIESKDPSASSIVLNGHEGAVTCVAFSPDNHWLVTTGMYDRTARLWDLTTNDFGAEPIIFHENFGSIGGAAFSPNNHWLVIFIRAIDIYSQDNVIAYLWDLTNLFANPITLRDGDYGTANAVAISSDSRWLVTGGGDVAVRLWNLTAKNPATKPFVLLEHKAQIKAVAFGPNNRWLVTGSADSTARLWDLSNDPAKTSIALRGHKDEITVVAISNDNHWLVTGSNDATVRLWDLTANDPTASPIVLRGHEGPIQAATFTPDNHWLITGSRDGTLRMWNLTTKQSIASPIILDGHNAPIRSVAFSPNNNWLATGSSDHTARLWDLTELTRSPFVLAGHDSAIRSIAFSPDNHWLVTGSDDSTACIWDLTADDLTTSPIVLRRQGGSIRSVAFSSDNRWLATGSDGDITRLWNVSTITHGLEFLALRTYNPNCVVAFSFNNHWLVTSGSFHATAKLWDMTATDSANTPILLISDPFEDAWHAVAFSPNSHWLAIAGGAQYKDNLHNVVHLWDLTKQDFADSSIALFGHTDQVNSISFSPNNHWLATGSSDATVRLWDITQKDPVASTIVLRGHDAPIYALVFSHDNHWLVTGSDDNTVRLWDMSTAHPNSSAIILRGHANWVTAVAVSYDDHWLATAGWDNTVRLWNLRIDELVDLACRTAGRNLTIDEWEQYFPGQQYRKTCPSLPVGKGVSLGISTTVK